MGNRSLHANSASEEFDCKPCLYSPGCTGICIEQENTFKVMPLEDDILSASQNVGMMVQELGVALNQILYETHTTCEPVDCNLSTNNDTVLPQKEMKPHMAANLLTDTIKDPTISCFEVVQPPSLAMSGKDDISCMFVHDSLLKAEKPNDSVLKAEKSNDEGPSHLPASPKPTSAMKGSRAQQGTPSSFTKLSVKWSSDVYDPPVTSDSHTVKGHRQRPRAKKDQHKNRYNKSKSPRGSSSDKKHAHGRSTSRLRAYRDGTSVVDVDYVVSCQELKFGSSCYVESLPQVHLSVAEAS